MSVFLPVLQQTQDRCLHPHVQQMNLHEWVKTTPSEFANSALYPCTSPLGSKGILLKELSPGLLAGVETYIQNLTPRQPHPKPVTAELASTVKP